jgi:hypothetical protein
MAELKYIDDVIMNINNIRQSEFKKHNFQYDDKIIENKQLNENTMEYKNFKNIIVKKAKLEKLKPGNICKKEYENTENDIDILEDDIFMSDEKNDNIKLDFDKLTIEEKMTMINEYLNRKNIILDEMSMKKIEEIVNDSNTQLKKYINISKMYQHVIKISFIKKRENGTYDVEINNDKQIKKNKKFFIIK